MLMLKNIKLRISHFTSWISVSSPTLYQDIYPNIPIVLQKIKRKKQRQIRKRNVKFEVVSKTGCLPHMDI